MQQKILLRDSLSGCEAINDKEYIQITYDPNELNFSPEVLGSLYFLRALYKNEEAKGLCILKKGSKNPKVLAPPGEGKIHLNDPMPFILPWKMIRMVLGVLV